MQKRTEKAAACNTCKLCAPLGACLAFKGIENSMVVLHGSQGCSTYIRRYMIGHFREPVDIASSSFTEKSAIFGGEENLQQGLTNLVMQYNPSLIGVATTCLAETIGDDIKMFVSNFKKRCAGVNIPEIIDVSTPSYTGSHSLGYKKTVKALVEHFFKKEKRVNRSLLLPTMISPEDIRFLYSLYKDFSIPVTILPDYSDTLDGPTWGEYSNIPKGGTSMDELKTLGSVSSVIEFGSLSSQKESCLGSIAKVSDTYSVRIPVPIGIAATDKFLEVLEKISGKRKSAELESERGRLIDSYIDAHKHIFGKKVVLYGEEDLVSALATFCDEIGMDIVICATGTPDKALAETLNLENQETPVEVLCDTDFETILEKSKTMQVDLIIGNSKGYYLSKNLDVPLVRVGFPIQDRIGAQRVRIIGYSGTQILFDRVVNAIIEDMQKKSPIGYLTY